MPRGGGGPCRASVVGAGAGAQVSGTTVTGTWILIWAPGGRPGRPGNMISIICWAGGVQGWATTVSGQTRKTTCAAAKHFAIPPRYPRMLNGTVSPVRWPASNHRLPGSVPVRTGWLAASYGPAPRRGPALERCCVGSVENDCQRSATGQTVRFRLLLLSPSIGDRAHATP